MSSTLDLRNGSRSRPRWRRSTAALTISLSLVAVLAACSSSSKTAKGGSGSPTNTSPAGSSSSSPAASTSPASGSGSASAVAGDPAIGAAGTQPVFNTVGPNGETPVAASSISLTPAQVAQLQKGGYTAAMVWHESATFTSAVTNGAKAEFARLGIKVLSVTDANFDAATQTNQLQTVLSEHPSTVLSLPVNPVTEASAYGAVQQSGTKLVVLSNVPSGLKFPSQYSGMVTDDLAAMGKQAAVLLGTAMNGHGDVGLIYYSADYYVTNERDAAFRSWLRKLYPNIHIVAQEAMADQSKAQSVAAAMLTRYPNITGIYTPWSQTPAEGVLAALRSAGRTNVKVVTLDLDPSIDASLCQGQYLSGIVADQPYLLGKTMADVAALAILGQQTPPFTDVPALQVTKDNILGAWQTTLDQAAPAAASNACKS